ncbi:hypothetical protein [Candidatus Finniella inopinata]|uniref:Uncharacterized protein n=1 Tax=Candidatus Finniella inopinata TaxID=1696036 RepID=A0A4Q7DKG8_9PROT|nr:hypothetical protein [Candidatus Finniella inopinata]RZI46880.1 hypothetical protein EQU50_01260 [Candidatus Finniella inopinata]
MKFIVKILTLVSMALGGSAWDRVEAIENVEETYKEYQEAKKTEESVRATSNTKSEITKAANNTRIKRQSHFLTCDQACSYFSCRDKAVKEACMKRCPSNTIGHCVGGLSTKKSDDKYNIFLKTQKIMLDENKIPMPSDDDRETSLSRSARPTSSLGNRSKSSLKRSSLGADEDNDGEEEAEQEVSQTPRRGSISSRMSISKTPSKSRLVQSRSAQEDTDEQEDESLGADGEDVVKKKMISRTNRSSSMSSRSPKTNSNRSDADDDADSSDDDRAKRKSPPSRPKSSPASTDVAGTTDGKACVCSITGLKAARAPSSAQAAAQSVDSNNSAASNATTTVVKEAATTTTAPAPAPKQEEKVAAPPAATKSPCEIAGEQNGMTADDAAANGLC